MECFVNGGIHFSFGAHIQCRNIVIVGCLCVQLIKTNTKCLLDLDEDSVLQRIDFLLIIKINKNKPKLPCWGKTGQQSTRLGRAHKPHVQTRHNIKARSR